MQAENETNRLLKRLVALMEENVRYARFQALPEIRRTLEQALVTEVDRRIYQASFHDRTVSEVARQAGTSRSNVQRKKQDWVTRGIMVPSGTRAGRWERAFDLEAIGLIAPTAEEEEPDRGRE